MVMHAGRYEQRFADKYSDVTNGILVKLIAYVKSLLEGGGSGGTGAAGGPETGGLAIGDLVGCSTAAAKKRKYTIESREGFPVMPEVTEDAHLRKADVEDVMRQYLNLQYCKSEPV